MPPVNCAMRNSKSVTRLRIFNTKMSATIARTAARNSMIFPSPNGPPARACATLGRGRHPSGSSPPAESQSGRRALGEDLTAETEKGGRPTAGCGRGLAGRLDQRRTLHQAAEILLVQEPAGNRLDGMLQFGEREFGRHQLEH